MIKFTTANIFRKLNDILDLKKICDRTLKNIPTVGEVLLKIAWKCMKIALII